jgi:hypothetical protein
MGSDVCETFISVPTDHELRDPTVCVYFCHKTEHCRDLVYGQQSGVCMCVYILYTCIILVCPSMLLPKTGGSLPEHS